MKPEAGRARHASLNADLPIALVARGGYFSIMGVTIAICQTEGKFADPDAGLELLARETAIAAASGVELLILPEMFLSGYNLGQERAQELAMTAEDERIAKVRDLAAKSSVSLCFGFPERVDGAVANSAMLIDEVGAVRLLYRKVHLFGDIDRGMFRVSGDRFQVVAWRGLSVGVAICYDIEFPETARAMALAGADLILVPTALMPPYHVVADSLIPTRAYENQIYIAYANHCGSEDGLDYIGHSSICGPDGAVLAKAGAAPMRLTAHIDPAHLAEVRRRDPLLADRRPELYGAIAS